MARAAIIPNSPPKRATRGKAKTTTETAKTKSRVTKTTAEPKKRGTRTATTTTTRNAEDDSDATDDELDVIETKEKAKTTKPRGRPAGSTASAGTGRGRKAATPTPAQSESDNDEEDELAQTDTAPKKRGRPKKETTMKAEAPKARGRPRSTTTKQATAKDTEQDLTRKNTRANKELDSFSQSTQKRMVINTNSTVARSNLLRGPAKKKTVTFQDPTASESEDSESPAVPAAGRKMTTASTRQAGLGAKPVRKPAATGTGRGRKPAATKAKPLSPKKDRQVAKTLSAYVSSDGEDDELSGAKDQMKTAVDSPVRPAGNTGLSSPVKRINFTPNKGRKTVDENGEPTEPAKHMDFSESLFMSSPAKRPSASPFNFTMRETPRRAGFNFGDSVKSTTQPDFNPTQNSPLKTSPRKAKLETPRHVGLALVDDHRPIGQPNFTPNINSPLKLSPKKGGLGASFRQDSQPSSTPFMPKSSFLQSPAKRTVSPFKSSLFSKKESPIQQAAVEKEQYEPSVASSPLPAESPLTTRKSDDMDVERDEREVSLQIDELEAEIEAEDAGNQDMEDAAQDQPEEHDEEIDEIFKVPINKENGDEELGEEQELDADELVSDAEPNQEAAPELAEDHVELRSEDAVDDLPEQVEQHEEHFAEEGDQAQEQDGEQQDQEDEVWEEDIDAVDQVDVQSSPRQEALEEPAHAREQMEDQEAQADDAIKHDLPEQEEVEDPDATESEPEDQPGTGHEVLEDVFTDAPVLRPVQEPWTPEAAPESPAASLNQEVEEEDEASGDDFFYDDDETLVVFDEDEQYMATPGRAGRRSSRLVSQTPRQTPRRVSLHPTIQRQRIESPLRQVQNIPPPASSPVPAQSPAGEPVGQHDSPQESTTSNEALVNRHDTPQESMEPTEENIVPGTDMNAAEESRPQEESTPQPPARRTPCRKSHVRRSIFDGPRFTPLANQMSQWKAISPERAEPRRSRRGVFSIGGILKPSAKLRESMEVSYPDIANSIEDQPQIDEPEIQPTADQMDTEIHHDEYAGPDVDHDDVEVTPRANRQPMGEILSEADSTTPKDDPLASNQTEEMAPPTPSVHEDLDDGKENQQGLPAVPVTPKRTINPPRTFHTVSKVPLKPEGQVSPLKMPRKRGHSISNTSPVRSSPRIRNSLLSPKKQEVQSFSPRKSQKVYEDTAPKARVSIGSKNARSSLGQRRTPSRSPSPSKTPRRNINAYERVLGGAVVHVDVHTTEGEDASGIFVEVLQQMGARCVKNWAWNPRSSLSPVDGAEPKDGKVGITHVVFKDGGVRTLEKVRHAGGLVKCVGVGWVLDCERENKWLDEAQYAVDSSIIPRGGAKRRKSMEPRALSNVNGTLVKVDSTSTSASGRRSGADWSSMEDFMRNTPSVEPNTPQKSKGKGPTEADEDYYHTPKTPGYDFSNLDRIGMSPATPFYLSQRSKLVQQTCPAKQSQQGLFASSRAADDESSKKMRFKLEAARRRSLAFKPKIGSPLVE